MPLARLSTSRFSRTPPEVAAVNIIIDRYNSTNKASELDAILIAINRPARTFWVSRMSEILRLELTVSKMLHDNKGRSGEPIMGARAVRDVSPTRWLEKLDEAAPSLDAVDFDGVGKQGAQGNTLMMSLPNGKKLFGKTARGADKASEETETAREYNIYKKLFNEGRTHKNLVKVWGWATMKAGEQHEIGFIMDHIDGPDGRRFQSWLKEGWDLGYVSSAEYWSSLQYITRCHLRVISFLKDAGWVHNDIKPENYVVDKVSGEVVVIDLGGAARLGENPRAVTEQYLAPEMMRGGRPDADAHGTVASDVFALGASLAHAGEAAHTFHVTARPNQGLTQVAKPYRDIAAGGGVEAGRHRNPFQYAVESDYTRQLNRMMNSSPIERAKTVEETTSNRFVHDRILSNELTRKAMKGIASGDTKARWESKWFAAGKIPPKVSTVDRASLQTQLNKMVADYGRGYKESQVSIAANSSRTDAERVRTALPSLMHEAGEFAQLISFCKAFDIKTDAAQLRVNAVLKACDNANNCVQAILGIPKIVAAPPVLSGWQRAMKKT